MSGPARLHKVQEDNAYSWFNLVMGKVEAWCYRHAALCLFVLMALLIALFVMLMFAIVGVSATDSGVQYNQLQNII